MLIGLFLACLLPELVLQGADLGLWGSSRWRGAAYGYGGFWTGLLRDWRPNFAGQKVTMFVTYGFLHGGLVHLLVNMLTLAGLGTAVIERAGVGQAGVGQAGAGHEGTGHEGTGHAGTRWAGQRRFLMIYLMALLGGAAGFAVLSQSPQPMVGASGALFGLAGALAWWEYRDASARGSGPGPVLRTVGGLVVLNVVLWWAMDGLLAWQTHLGGFLAGAAAAAVPDRSGRRSGRAAVGNPVQGSAEQPGPDGPKR